MPATHFSISQSFAARTDKRIGLVPFIPAGYPDLATTTAVIQAVDAAGATAIEVGFPFTDPIADGPTIQQAYTTALSKKVKVPEILRAVQDAAAQISAPLVGMVSYSIVFRYGPDQFFSAAKSAGFAGLIIPDLPPPDAQPLCKKMNAVGLDSILLVAPTTSVHRRQEIVKLCTGFVYYLAVSGITGARADLPADLVENVRQLKSLTKLPVCVGFGISHARHLAALSKIADGAIVGSAIVKRMTDLISSTPESIAKSIGDYCRELLSY